MDTHENTLAYPSQVGTKNVHVAELRHLRKGSMKRTLHSALRSTAGKAEEMDLSDDLMVISHQGTVKVPWGNLRRRHSLGSQSLLKA